MSVWQLMPISVRNPLNRGRSGPFPDKSWPCITSEMRALGLRGKVLVNQSQPEGQGNTAPSPQGSSPVHVPSSRGDRQVSLAASQRSPPAFINLAGGCVTDSSSLQLRLGSSSIIGEGWLHGRAASTRGGDLGRAETRAPKP